MTQSSIQADATDRPETIIVHAAYPLWRKHTLVAMARARELMDQGHDVRMTYCNSRRGTCAVNYSGSPLICSICRNRTKQTAESLHIPLIPLETGDSVDRHEPPLKLSEQRELVEGVRSGIITTFRTLPGERAGSRFITGIRKRYFRTTRRLTQSMKAVLNRIRPDRVEVFNGRHACSRFVLIAAEQAAVPFNTLEVTTRQRPIVFRGHTAHDRRRIQSRMMQQPADHATADRYYSARRKPRHNKFARKHAAEFVPPAADGFRRRISVFLSSQDEFESLGREWRSPFPDYATTIRDICSAFPEDLFCIRFHPNQASISGDITSPFADIAEYPNVWIYYPADTANTYTLIDWSDLVVTFGSTVTVEACWMNRPVIQLGPSFFDNLNVSHNPTTLAELHELLRRPSLPVLDRDNAARAAAFEEYDWDPMKYLDYDGRTIRPNGIQVRYPVLSRLARSSDDLACNLIKIWSDATARFRRAG